MAVLAVEVPTPILIIGEGEQLAGEVWLTNASGADVTITGATLTVAFPTPESGPIALPDGVKLAPGVTRRLVVRSGIPPYTPPGTFTASIDVTTSAGPQTIPATVVITSVVNVAFSPSVLTFAGVLPSSTHIGRVQVLNRGNVAVDVGAIPDETLLEMVTIPRVVRVSGASVAVEPALGTTPGGTVTFANPLSTVPPGGWTSVDVSVTLPAALTAGRHFRILPRIANQRFVIDLLT